MIKGGLRERTVRMRSLIGIYLQKTYLESVTVLVDAKLIETLGSSSNSLSSLSELLLRVRSIRSAYALKV